MVIVRVKGGLGNQLFQYAAGYSLAKRLNTMLKLDTSFYPQQTLRGFKLDKLSVDYKETVVPGKMANLFKNKYLNKGLRIADIRKLPIGSDAIYILETRSDIMDLFFTETAETVYLDGYYQSEKYFADFREDIFRQFKPCYPAESEFRQAIEMVRTTRSVAVHVRRGDFIKGAKDSNMNHYLLGEQYYHNALKYMAQNLPEDAVYYWFSDDIEWVKKRFSEKANYRFITLHTKNADIDEMQVMRNCRHIIAANSTFSWWAAWMNENPNAIRTVPERRFGNLHMIPEGWVKIAVE